MPRMPSWLVRALFFLVCLCSSWDLFGMVNLGGMTFRLVYVLMALVLGLALLQGLGRERLLAGFHLTASPALLVWIFFLLVFVGSTPLWLRSAAYWLILAMYAGFIACLTALAPGREDRNSLIGLWLASFGVLGLFGIVQFVAGYLGTDILVSQRWEGTAFVRINGLSYEPSYYGLYMIPGWTVSFFLFVEGAKGPWRRLSGGVLGLSSIALVLCSSRMAWLVLALFLGGYTLSELVRIIVTRKIRALPLGVAGVGILCTLAGLVAVLARPQLAEVLLAGLGVGEGGSASISIRLHMQGLGLDAFLSNPFGGTSLGGVPVALAAQSGVRVSDTWSGKPFEAVNVFIEILVASGLMGFLAFISFLVLTGFRLLRIAKDGQGIQEALGQTLGRGLFWGLVLTMVLLVFGQNIMRPYIWVMLGVVQLVLHPRLESGKVAP